MHNLNGIHFDAIILFYKTVLTMAEVYLIKILTIILHTINSSA